MGVKRGVEVRCNGTLIARNREGFECGRFGHEEHEREGEGRMMSAMTSSFFFFFYFFSEIF